MATKHQSAQERLAKLQEIAETAPALTSAPARPAPGKPLTLRPSPELRTWFVQEADRQSMASGEPVTTQDVILQAMEAMRASRG